MRRKCFPGFTHHLSASYFENATASHISMSAYSPFSSRAATFPSLIDNPKCEGGGESRSFFPSSCKKRSPCPPAQPSLKADICSFSSYKCLLLAYAGTFFPLSAPICTRTDMLIPSQREACVFGHCVPKTDLLQ